MKSVNKKALGSLFILAVIIVTIMYFYNRHETFLEDNNNDTLLVISGASVNLDNVIPDATIKETVSSLLIEMRGNLMNYNNLDVPISINDKGETCAPWGGFDNSRYILQDNNCMILDSRKNVRSCLDSQGTVQTCNALYENGLINEKNGMQILPYLEEAKSRMIIAVKNIQNDLNIKIKEIDLKVSDIVGKKNIEGQQIFFIQYNLNNLDDKRKNVSKTIKETDDKENIANINQLKFSQFLENNKKNEARNNLYIKIMKWLAGIIFLLVIVYLLLQRVD